MGDAINFLVRATATWGWSLPHDRFAVAVVILEMLRDHGPTELRLPMGGIVIAVRVSRRTIMRTLEDLSSAGLVSMRSIEGREGGTFVIGSTEGAAQLFRANVPSLNSLQESDSIGGVSTAPDHPAQFPAQLSVELVEAPAEIPPSAQFPAQLKPGVTQHFDKGKTQLEIGACPVSCPVSDPASRARSESTYSSSDLLPEERDLEDQISLSQISEPTGADKTEEPEALRAHEKKPRPKPENIPPKAWKAADRFRELLLAKTPTLALANRQWSETSKLRHSWAATFKLLAVNDKRSWEEIGEVIVWLIDGDGDAAGFVVHSPDALREKWDRIHAVMKRPGRSGAPRGGVTDNRPPPVFRQVKGDDW